MRIFFTHKPNHNNEQINDDFKNQNTHRERNRHFDA